MRSVRILLTCLGGRFSVDTVMILRRSKNPPIRIVGVDMNPNIIAKHFVDSFYKVPYGGDSKYIEIMMRICQKEKVEIIEEKMEE